MPKLMLSLPLLLTLWLCSSADAQLCGDCDGDGVPGTIVDSLVAGQLSLVLFLPTPSQVCTCDVNSDGSATIVDALLLAQKHIGLAPALQCNSACNATVLSSCRAVHQLMTTAPGPVGVNPFYTTANGGRGNPPLSGNIGDTNPLFTHFWDFDYQGLGQGTFNHSTALTDQAGNNVGNPVVLMSAGHDYRPQHPDPIGACNPADTFQVVLEGTLSDRVGATRIDLAAATTPYAGTTLSTTWQSSDPGCVSVSPNGLLTAMAENCCATISYSVASANPMQVFVPATWGTLQPRFSACVDSGGVDTTTRQTWLPVGDTDVTFPSLPSGPAVGGVGSSFGLTAVINVDTFTLAFACYQSYFDSAVMVVDRSLDTLGVGGSIRMGNPFSVNTGTPGEAHWYDLDVFGFLIPGGITDFCGINMLAVGPGTASFRLEQLFIAEPSTCVISTFTPCMPWSAVPCNPSVGTHIAIAGTGRVVVP